MQKTVIGAVICAFMLTAGISRMSFAADDEAAATIHPKKKIAHHSKGTIKGPKKLHSTKHKKTDKKKIVQETKSQD